ncbi:hypothetical protein RJ639_003028 [Escallonia herrerae]|uniref:UspA domain-containing protein n=1 Tax=Escallonia herrerae TaxID=1293975 RepID=A0AA89AVS6_9ASTE|nr:hypothetical protein RJ639_003028 [Escallonia herrerae]
MWVLENLDETIKKSGNHLVIFMAQPLPNNINVFAASLGTARMYCNVSSTPDLVLSVQEQNYRVTKGILEKAKGICTSHGIQAEMLTEVGDARQAICDAVQKYTISLLVLGDHGLGQIKRAFLGSVSTYCVQNTKCQVLVVKKPE